MSLGRPQNFFSFGVFPVLAARGGWQDNEVRLCVVWANKLFEIPLFSHFSMYGCSQARTCCQQRSLTLL